MKRTLFLIALLCSYLAVPLGLSAQLTISPSTYYCIGTPTPLTVSGGTPGNAMHFDRATKDQVQIPVLNLNGTSALTLEAWVNPSNITSYSNYNIIRQDGGGAPAGWLLAFQNSGNILSFGLNTTSGYKEVDVAISPTNFVNQWNHVAGVYNGAQLRLYVNGLLVGTKAHTGTILSNGSIHRISGGPNNEFFQGTIDDVRLWNAVRTAPQLLANYDQKLLPPQAGLVGDWRFDECSGTVVYDSSGNGNNGNMVNAPTRVIVTTAPIQPLYVWTPATGLSQNTGSSVMASPASTTTYTVTARDNNCNLVTGQVTISPYNCSCVSISASPSSTICSGDTVTLTATGGFIGNAIDFDRADQDEVTLPVLNLNGNGAITLEAWVNPSDITSQTFYNIIRQDGPGMPSGWLLAFQNSGNFLTFGVRTSNGYSELDVPITASFYVNQWHHVAGVYNGATMRLYVDGVQIGSQNHTGTIQHTGNVHRISGGPNGEFFEGMIDEVRLWTVARTATEIADNFDLKLIPPVAGLLGDWRFDECSDTIAYDSSGNGLDGVLRNSPTRIIPTTAPIQPLYYWSTPGLGGNANGASIQVAPNDTTTYTVVSRCTDCTLAIDQITINADTCPPPCAAFPPYRYYHAASSGTLENGPGDETLLLEPDGSTVSVGTVVTSFGTDVILTKTDPQGNVMWSQTYGNSWFNERGYALERVTLSSNPGYIIVGTTDETSPANDLDILVIKVDLMGNQLATGRFGDTGNGNEGAVSVDEDMNGNFIIGGYYQAWGTPSQYYALLIDPALTQMWARTYTQNGYTDETIKAIMALPGGEYAFLGRTQTASSGWDFSLFVLNNSGITNWSAVYDSQGEFANDMIPTMSGGFAITGEYDMPPFTAKTAAFLLELDPAGNPVWGQLYGVENDINAAYSVLENGNGYALGAVASEGMLPLNHWLLETDPTGNPLNSKIYPDRDDHAIHDLDQDDCGYLLHGTYYEPTGSQMTITRTDDLGETTCFRDTTVNTAGINFNFSAPMVFEGPQGNPNPHNLQSAPEPLNLNDCLVFQKKGSSQPEALVEDGPVLTIYPNPLTSQQMLSISVELQNAEPLEIVLLDAAGKLVSSRSLQFETGRTVIEMDLGELPSGLYMLRVEGAQFGRDSKKIQVLR